MSFLNMALQAMTVYTAHLGVIEALDVLEYLGVSICAGRLASTRQHAVPLRRCMRLLFRINKMCRGFS